jgi:dTDP-4-dehydrorhamnose reductase
MILLVTGSDGQLGNELKTLTPAFPGYTFLFTDVADLDITNQAQVGLYFARYKPDAVINCAAYTAVDKAETDETTAFRVNALAPGILAAACSASGALMVHVSTDYVFDGRNHRPYTETDPLNPVSAYGRSKAAGEAAVSLSGAAALIIRTSWLYSSFGNNFVKTIRRVGSEKESLNVVSDQAGTPTYARDLAAAILEILPKAAGHKGTEIYHYSNQGIASWYDFAQAIAELSGLTCEINPIATSQYPLPAERPVYSVLDKTKICTDFGLSVPYWRTSLKACINALNKLP